jgi:hypothetical protein
MGAMKERMLRGEPYIADDEDLAADSGALKRSWSATTALPSPSRSCEIGSCAS